MILNDYVIALYIRLSANDKKVESNSIEHQKLLLTKYAENMEIPNIKLLEFVDNGYSGTNFERPAIQELLELVKTYQVNCIMVKDFSRFGRNIIQTGYFLEQVFPLYHVRFISVTENYDSDKAKNNTGGIPVTIQFLKNEYYSRDLSQKAKSAKYSKMEKGEYIQKNCCYGYKKEDNTLKIDESAANTVKLIFQLALQGNNYTKIVKELYNKKIVIPEIYKQEKRRKKTECYNPYIWSTTTVKGILVNEQYTGTYIMRKSIIKEVGGKSIKREEKDWIKIPNHHEAIIEKEVFEQVQKQLSHSKIKKEKKRILKGKVYCGYCRHAMFERLNKNTIFLCRHSEVDTSFPCYHLKIAEKEVEEIVFQMILKQIEIIKDRKQISNIDVQTTQKIELQNQIRLHHEKKKILYQQYIEKKLTEEQFTKSNLELTKELEPIQNKLEEIDFQLQHSQNRNALQNQIEKITENTTFTLTKELVELFVGKIYIFQESRIEVEWKIKDFMKK